MNYFKDCCNKDAVKQLYRELAKKLHPDAGGKAEDMVELQRQYEIWKDPSPFGSKEHFKYFKEAEQKAREEMKQSYGGYGGYRYNNQSTMWNEYKKQSSDPRIADYERMKSENKILHNNNWILRNDNIQLKLENEKLKKKFERLKKKISPKEKRISKSIHL